MEIKHNGQKYVCKHAAICLHEDVEQPLFADQSLISLSSVNFRSVCCSGVWNVSTWCQDFHQSGKGWRLEIYFRIKQINNRWKTSVFPVEKPCI